MSATKIVLALVIAGLTMLAQYVNATRAEKLFRNLRLNSKDPRYRFHGSTAKIVHDKVESHDGAADMLYRYCKNEHGEYFVFMYAGGLKPYIKHLTRERARQVLEPYPAVYEREFGSEATRRE